MRHAIAVLLCIATGAVLAPAAGATMYKAPGRTIFDVGIPAPTGNVDASGASAALALPDGSVVLAGMARGRELVLAKARPNGELDAAFGDNGIAHHDIQAPFTLLQLLQQKDGRLLVVATAAPIVPGALPHLFLRRFEPNGAVDRSFGLEGTAETGLGGSCANCAPAGLQSDGTIVLTGSTGEYDRHAWAVMRLKPDGQVFSLYPLEANYTAQGPNAGGYSTVVAPDDTIFVLGRFHDQVLVARTTPLGDLDKSFNGGTPAPVPVPFALELLRQPNGSLDVLGSGTLAQLTPTGAVDRSFGSGGTVQTATSSQLPSPAQMLATPDGGTLVYSGAIFTPVPSATSPLAIQHVDASGRLGAVVTPPMQFGGGFASSAGVSQIPTTALAQNGFSPAKIVQRPDGSYLVAGGVRIVRYTGEGEGFSTGLFATEALDPAFAPITSYGGPSSPAGSSLTVPRQSARSDARLGRVLVRFTTVQPGLMLLRVRDGHRRVLAQSLEPIYKAGTTTVRIPLTATGRRILGRGRGLRVLVGRGFRGVTTGGYEGQTAANLR